MSQRVSTIMLDVFTKNVKISDIMSEISYGPILGLFWKEIFVSGKKLILPEMFFLLFVLNINVAVRPFIVPPVALYLPCSITSACSPPSCHLTFVF